MRKRFMTTKKEKFAGFMLAGFFCLAFIMWAAFRMGLIAESITANAEIAFNTSLAISVLLLIFGVIAPLNATDIYYRSRSTWLRDRIGKSIISKQFIIDESDHE